MIRKVGAVVGLVMCGLLQGCATFVVSYEGGQGYQTSLRIMHYPPIKTEVH